MATLRIEGLSEDKFREIALSAFRRDVPIRDEIIRRLWLDGRQKTYPHEAEAFLQRFGSDESGMS